MYDRLSSIICLPARNRTCGVSIYIIHNHYRYHSILEHTRATVISATRYVLLRLYGSIRRREYNININVCIHLPIDVGRMLEDGRDGEDLRGGDLVLVLLDGLEHLVGSHVEASLDICSYVVS